MIYQKLSDGTIDWCVMCKHEGDDFYDLCCECEYPENSDENSDDPPAKFEPKPMTNADRIRSMSDYELAELFESWIQDCGCNSVPCLGPCEENIKNYGAKSCQECWLDWLRQEATE